MQRSWGSRELGILKGQGESSVRGARGVRGAWKGSEGQMTPWIALLAVRSHSRKTMGLMMGSSVWNPSTEGRAEPGDQRGGHEVVW